MEEEIKKHQTLLSPIFDRLADIEASVKKLNKRFTWQEQVTESGIQLQGSTTVSRSGTLLAACPIQIGPQQMTVAFCLQEESSGKIYVVSAEACKPALD